MSDDVQALQEALESEHAIIWAYGVIGAVVSDPQIPAVTAADTRHRTRRGELEAIIRGLGQEPAPSQPAYTLPSPVTDEASALSAAAHLEEAAAKQWRYCTGRVSTEGTRAFCVDALIESTGAMLSWRAAAGEGVSVPAFPGLA